MAENQPNAQDNWLRTQAILWFLRQIENAAIELYMRHQSAEAFVHIRNRLMEALRGISEHDLDAQPAEMCEWPWCPEPDDRCVPCENGEAFRQSRGRV